MSVLGSSLTPITSYIQEQEIVENGGICTQEQGWFLGGGAPLLQLLLNLGGSAPLEFLHWVSFSEFIGLASKVLWSTVDCYFLLLIMLYKY